MSKDARELVAEMSAIYRDAEEARVANYDRLNLDAQLRDRPICAGQTVWILFIEPVTLENALNHPGYVLLSGEVRDTRETSYEVTVAGRVQTFERAQLYIRRDEAELAAQTCNVAIARRLAELHDGELN